MKEPDVPVVAAAFIAVFAAVLVYGCAETGNLVKGQAVAQEEFFNSTLHFCSREDCLQRIISQLNNARNSVKCAFYTADEHLIGNIPATVAAEIVFDEKAKAAAANRTMSDCTFRLWRNCATNSANKTVYKSKSNGIMHNKYCIIDGITVITGSFNPTEAAKNDYNDLLIINSTSLAAFYNKNFEQLKGSIKQKTAATAAATAVAKSVNRKAAVLNDTATEVYFCPEDGCAAAVKEKIREAKSSIAFAAYSFTHPEIANELIIKKSEGIAVAGVIEKSTTGSKYSKHAVMAANGIDIKLESSKRLLHHKFFVIDNETVITGSFNPTKNADERNDENMVIIRNNELAKEYAEEFNKIFGDVDARK